jgi:hypothetical protein
MTARLSPMNISLEQAIEIHARALVNKFREGAPVTARRYAAARRDCGDPGGPEVWIAVALAAERILLQFAEEAASDESAFAAHRFK